MKQRLIWYIKQLLPLKYDTVFRENEVKKLCIWHMWLGRCFNIRYFQLAE
jgi:hypothetical protein